MNMEYLKTLTREEKIQRMDQLLKMIAGMKMMRDCSPSALKDAQQEYTTLKNMLLAPQKYQ